MAGRRLTAAQNLVTVFAASGRQGPAVVRALRDAGRALRGNVRNRGGAEARQLAGAGAEVVAGLIGRPPRT